MRLLCVARASDGYSWIVQTSLAAGTATQHIPDTLFVYHLISHSYAAHIRFKSFYQFLKYGFKTTYAHYS